MAAALGRARTVHSVNDYLVVAVLVGEFMMWVDGYVIQTTGHRYQMKWWAYPAGTLLWPGLMLYMVVCALIVVLYVRGGDE